LLDSANDVFHCCPAIDNLLDGGLKRGHVFELLGPPGTPKTALVLEIIRDFIENKEDVLIIGIYLHFPRSVLARAYLCALDPQNTIAPGVIDEKLRSETAIHLFSRAGAHCDTAFLDSFSIRWKGLFATRTSNGNISCGRVNGVPQHVAILLARESKGTRERVNHIRQSSVRMTRCFGSRLPYWCCLHFRSSFSCRPSR